MIPKKIYLNYVNEDDEEKTWCVDPVYAEDCEMQNREYTDLSQVWHNVSERPEPKAWFIAQIGEKCFDTFIVEIDKNDTWAKWSKGINITRWAYVDNLLPKGGNEKDMK